MEELKKLKLEVVAMQDKIKFIDSMKVIINKPFDELSIRFLEDLSGEIKKINKIYTYPDLVYLMMWCAKKNLLKLKKKYKSNSFKIGRGLVFHVCPNNVPVNFIYSFIIGLLSGNSNIVKLPSKNFKERNILLKSINKLFNLKRYQDFKKSNLFINYDHEQENYLTEHISSKSDARIIWGGDKTIETLKKIITPARCIDVCFADRYSVSIINGKKFNLLKQSSLDLLARKYFYDVYSMDQLACNSPHFLFWIGKISEKNKNYFFKKISNIAQKKFSFDEIHMMNKYSNLTDKIMKYKNIGSVKMYENYLYTVKINNQNIDIENIRGVNGIIFQLHIQNINKLSNYVKKKCQTITYFGVRNKEFESLITKYNLLGGDRIVEIGKAFNFNLIWDGIDTINILSRTVGVE